MLQRPEARASQPSSSRFIFRIRLQLPFELGFSFTFTLNLKMPCLNCLDNIHCISHVWGVGEPKLGLVPCNWLSSTIGLFLCLCNSLNPLVQFHSKHWKNNFLDRIWSSYFCLGYTIDCFQPLSLKVFESGRTCTLSKFSEHNIRTKDFWWLSQTLASLAPLSSPTPRARLPSTPGYTGMPETKDRFSRKATYLDIES